MKRELRALLDENIGLKVYYELRNRGHHVQSVLRERRGIPDEEIIKIAIEHDKVIVTMDKDFGYLAQAYNPPGVVILRLKDPDNTKNRIKAILRALSLGSQLYGPCNNSNRDKNKETVNNTIETEQPAGLPKGPQRKKSNK